MFSSEYGWQTNYILELTIREISWRIKSINKRNKQDVNFQLMIRGLPKIEDPGEKPEPKKVDPSKQAAMDQAIKEARERKAREYGRKINNKN